MYTRDRKEKRAKEFSPSKCLLVQLRDYKMSIQSSQTHFSGPTPTQRAMPCPLPELLAYREPFRCHPLSSVTFLRVGLMLDVFETPFM